MEQTVYQQYLSLLRQELIPAMGCTEPIALAYCAAATWDAAGGGVPLNSGLKAYLYRLTLSATV